MPTRRRLVLAATAVVSIAYLVLGVQPHAPSALAGVPDTVTHAGAYALLGALAAEAGAVLGAPLPALAGWTFAVGHGALLEAMQSRVPTRRAEWSDFAADGAGAALAAVAWLIARRR